MEILEVNFELIKFLLKEPSGLGADIALNLFHSYYIFQESDKTLPKDLSLTLLLHPVFWDNPENVSRDQMVDYYWKEIALKVINIFPETESLLADQMIKSFGVERSIIGGFHSYPQEVLIEIVKRNPKQLWGKIKKYLGPPLDSRAFYLKEWLRGGKFFTKSQSSVLELFNPGDIWRWVDDDITERAWYLATFVPSHLFHSKEKICLARELLVRYGDQEDVRRNFSANYSTEGWTGPRSTHYINKKKDLLEFKENESNGNVIKWIEEYLEVLERDIERAKRDEERSGF